MIQIRYKIYTKEENKEGYYEWKPKEDYSTQEKAEDKIKKSYRKSEFKDHKIIIIPDEFKIGLKIWSGTKRISGAAIPKEEDYLYGTIVDEDKNYYYIQRGFKDENDRVPFHKDFMEEKYLEGYWSVKEDD